MDIKDLWTATCSGDIYILKEYFENGGEINKTKNEITQEKLETARRIAQYYYNKIDEFGSAFSSDKNMFKLAMQDIIKVIK